MLNKFKVEVMLKAVDLISQSIDELEAQCDDYQKSLFRLVNEAKQTKKAEKPHLIREKRKDIARLRTTIRQKQLEKQSNVA